MRASTRARRRLGVIGTFVWDEIHGRDPAQAPIEEWGGIAYALSALDASLGDEWWIHPIIRVGSDLASRANEFLHSLRHAEPGAPLIEVPYPNNRVTLRYVSAERRSERLSGGIPPWSWLGLKPLLKDVDALYINLISGWEIDLETAQLIRQHFDGPIYCDLHSMVLGVDPTGLRVPQPVTNVAGWMACFDAVQVNEDEAAAMAPSLVELAAIAMANGVASLNVTLGPRGAVYFVAPSFERLSDLDPTHLPSTAALGGAIRTALVPVLPGIGIVSGDPTGCGDVWGATYFARMLRGDKFCHAIEAAMRAAARNVEHRGATALANYLRGEITVT